MPLSDLIAALSAATGPSREALRCDDCDLLYSDPGWVDTYVPDDVWAKIHPERDGGGVMCLTCITRRVVAAGLDRIPLQVTSGPWTHEPNEAHYRGWQEGHAIGLAAARLALAEQEVG
jgi:hypothetical protein